MRQNAVVILQYSLSIIFPHPHPGWTFRAPPAKHPRMLRRAYDWCIAAADKPYALWLLGAISFAESSFFPIPPDVMLIPMSLAHPKRAYTYALLCSIASVAGGSGVKLGPESAGASPWLNCAKAGACASANAITHGAATRTQTIAGLQNPIMSPGRKTRTDRPRRQSRR